MRVKTGIESSHTGRGILVNGSPSSPRKEVVNVFLNRFRDWLFRRRLRRHMRNVSALCRKNEYVDVAHYLRGK